jgi:hypothetical protein
MRWYEESGLAGLAGKSRRPRNSPYRKIFNEQEQQILLLRHNSNLGARCIQNELKRQFQLYLSLATIHKILVKNKVKPLRRPKREKRARRYSKTIPGERVQVDTCKIASGIYQYTAVDDCTRYQVLIDFSEDHLRDRLSEYQRYYNWDRLHGSPGKTPMNRVAELSQKTLLGDQVEDVEIKGVIPLELASTPENSYLSTTARTSA